MIRLDYQVKMIRLDCHLHVEGQGFFPKEFLYFFDEDWACPDEKKTMVCVVYRVLSLHNVRTYRDILVVDLMKLS